MYIFTEFLIQTTLLHNKAYVAMFCCMYFTAKTTALTRGGEALNQGPTPADLATNYHVER